MSMSEASVAINNEYPSLAYLVSELESLQLGHEIHRSQDTSLFQVKSGYLIEILALDPKRSTFNLYVCLPGSSPQLIDRKELYYSIAINTLRGIAGIENGFVLGIEPILGVLIPV